MRQKLTGGLLGAAYQNACNVHALGDTHMLVFRQRQSFSLSGHMHEGLVMENSKTVSLKGDRAVSDYLLDGQELLKVYALSALTDDENAVGSRAFDEKFSKAKVAFKVLDGRIVFKKHSDYRDKAVDLERQVA